MIHYVSRGWDTCDGVKLCPGIDSCQDPLQLIPLCDGGRGEGGFKLNVAMMLFWKISLKTPPKLSRKCA